ncbi:hypothetical protein D3C71_2082260 [compost metagenome]
MLLEPVRVVHAYHALARQRLDGNDGQRGQRVVFRHHGLAGHFGDPMYADLLMVQRQAADTQVGHAMQHVAHDFFGAHGQQLYLAHGQ